MENQQESRDKRSKYRQLQEKFTKHKQHFLSTEDNQLPAFIQEVDQLQQGVSKPREQAVDSELFKGITEAGLSWVGKLAQGGKSFTAVDFIRRLKLHYVNDTNAQQRGTSDPSAFDWAALGRRISPFFRPAPVVYHMWGPMDDTPKERRQVVRQKRKAQVGDAVRPEELADIGDSEKQETDKNMEEMWRVLKAQGGRADLLALVLNHQSFAQTVENLFTLSFLVRDKKVELLATGDGTEVVMRAPQKGAAKKEEERERVQFVVELDIDTWETFKEVVDSASTLMPHRREHHHAMALETLEEQLPPQQQQQQQQQQPQEAGDGEPVGTAGEGAAGAEGDGSEEEDEAAAAAPAPAKRRKSAVAAAPAAKAKPLKKLRKGSQVKVKEENPSPAAAAAPQVMVIHDDSEASVIDLLDDSDDEPQQPPPQQQQRVASTCGKGMRSRQ